MSADLSDKWPRTLGEAQKVVDAIRFRLQSEIQTNSPELQELARQYALLCRRCNDRLREAESLLKQGNLAQALQICDVEPRLLDLVSTVDLPERPEWMQLVVLYDLAEPEPVLMDIGEQLNAAYSQGASIETLLARHRLLALARAPLMERAQVLRLLRNHDPSSHHWVEDLRELESAWLREAESDIQSAFARRDTGFLRELVGHLESRELLEPPPDRLVKLAKSRLETLVRANARKILESVAEKLDEAFSAMDRGRAVPLRSQWMQQSVVARLAPDDPLVLRVSPALSWLMDQDALAAADGEFLKAEQKLRDALAARDTSPDELQQSANRLFSLGRDIPLDLSDAYHQRMAAVATQDRRRRQLVIGAVAAGLLVVGGLAAVTVSAYRNAQALAALVTQINGLLGQDDLAAAEPLMARLAGYGSSPERTQLEARFAELQTAEKSRRGRYEAGLAEARAPGLAADKALLVVQRTAPLARLGTEKEELAALEKTFRDRIEADQMAADTEVQRLCAQLDNELKQLGEPRPDEAELNRVRNALEKSDPEFARLQTLAERASGNRKIEVAAVASRRKAYRVSLDQSRKKLEYFSEMDRQSLIDPAKPGVNPKTMLTAWHETWKRYSTTFPDDPLSRNDQLDDEHVHWSAALDAARLLNGGQAWIPAERWVIESRAKSLAERASAFESVPEGTLVRQYRELLESALQRHLGPDGNQASGTREKMRQLLKTPLTHDTYVVVVDKLSYYLGSREDAQQVIDTRKIRYIVGNAIGLTKNSLISKDVVSDAELKSWKVTRSPQAVFAEQFLPAFDEKSGQDWLDATEAMAKALINHPRWEFAVGRPESNSDKPVDTPIAIDPMQRFLLLRAILQYAGEGHSLLREELRSRMAVLDDPDLNLDALWMDPKNTAGTAARGRAEAKLNQARPILEAWPAARRREDSLRSAALRSLRAIGWATRNGDDSWEIRTNWKPEPGWVVELFLPAESGSSARWITIGSVGAGGQMPTLSTHTESLREGRLVFIRSKPKD